MKFLTKHILPNTSTLRPQLRRLLPSASVWNPTATISVFFATAGLDDDVHKHASDTLQRYHEQVMFVSALSDKECTTWLLTNTLTFASVPIDIEQGLTYPWFVNNMNRIMREYGVSVSEPGPDPVLNKTSSLSITRIQQHMNHTMREHGHAGGNQNQPAASIPLTPS